MISFVVGQFKDGRFPFKGRIDDYRIYNTVLSHAEIVSLANVASVTVPPAGDVNSSGSVDVSDLQDLASNWISETLWPAL
jgi:hypothetical protein